MYSIKELNNSQKVCQHILIENLSDFINRFLSNVYKNCKERKKGRNEIVYWYLWIAKSSFYSVEAAKY